MEISSLGAAKSRTVGWGALVLVLLGTSAYGLLSLQREHRRSQDLQASNQALSASLQQTRSQMEAISDKLNALAAQTAPASNPAPVAWEASKARSAAPVARGRAAAARPAEDPRWKQVQAKLADQQKEIAATRDEVAHTRDALNTHRVP